MSTVTIVYPYKANWNKDDRFIHIAGKRQPRSGDTTAIMAFTPGATIEVRTRHSSDSFTIQSAE